MPIGHIPRPYRNKKSPSTAAPDLFLTAVTLDNDQNLEIVGYVCGTLADSDSLTEQSMATHDDNGSLLCIHSVCVKENERRKGIALDLLKMYLSLVTHARPGIHAIKLICKEHLVGTHYAMGMHGGAMYCVTDACILLVQINAGFTLSEGWFQSCRAISSCPR